MEVTQAAPAGGTVPGGKGAKLLREPLFWAALAAFVGVLLGVSGAVHQATLGDTFYVDPTSMLVSQVAQLSSGAFVAVSSTGVVYLLWRVLRGVGRRVVFFGLAALGSLLAAEAVGVASVVYWNTGNRMQGYAEPLFPTLEMAAFHAIVFLPPLVLLAFAVGSLASRELRLGVVLASLCLLSVPYGFLQVLLFPPDPGAYTEPGRLSYLLLTLFGWYQAGVSLSQAPLWVLLGLMLLRRARFRTLGGASRAREMENLEAARRLYDEGLARGDASVVDDLVSEDFRDLGRGSRGKLAMERVFSALWRTYPDLAISVESRKAEDDLVETRLTLSGTDRGGVLWYPPTGRRATFTAEFTDRFVDGKLVEHSGKTDTEALLHQLGLSQEG